MSFHVVEGDVFASNVEAIVIPVNCVGVAGAGIALEARKRFPEWYRQYGSDCTSGRLTIGSITFCAYYNQFLFNFPAKDHWKLPSRYEYIEKTMPELRKKVEYIGVKSLALPAVGCGLGGLNFNVIRALAEKTFQDSSVDVLFYKPAKG